MYTSHDRKQMSPVTLVDDLIPQHHNQSRTQVSYPSVMPQVRLPVGAALTAEDLLLHEVRQIKYIGYGMAIALFFMLLILILRKN